MSFEVACGVNTGRGVTSIKRLLSLVLPFTAGALLNALEGLCSQPYAPATALVGLALLQPSAIGTGSQCMCNATNYLPCSNQPLVNEKEFPKTV